MQKVVNDHSYVKFSC